MIFERGQKRRYPFRARRVCFEIEEAGDAVMDGCMDMALRGVVQVGTRFWVADSGDWHMTLECADG